MNNWETDELLEDGSSKSPSLQCHASGDKTLSPPFFSPNIINVKTEKRKQKAYGNIYHIDKHQSILK